MTPPPGLIRRSRRGRAALPEYSPACCLREAQQLVIRPTLQIKLLTGSGHENHPISAPGGGDTAGYRFSSRVASPGTGVTVGELSIFPCSVQRYCQTQPSGPSYVSRNLI